MAMPPPPLFRPVCVLTLSVLLVTMGCQSKKHTLKEEPSSPRAELSVSEGSPGMTVVLSVRDAKFYPTQPVVVYVAGRPAPARVLSATALEVQIPQVPPGPTHLETKPPAAEPVRLPITVLESAGTELVLTLKGQQLQLLAQYPTAGMQNAPPRPGASHLRVELLNAGGVVASRTVIDDPRQAEVFDQADGQPRIRNEMNHAPLIFRVKVPKLPGGTIQVFEVPPNIDAMAAPNPDLPPKGKLLGKVVLPK